MRALSTLGGLTTTWNLYSPTHSVRPLRQASAFGVLPGTSAPLPCSPSSSDTATSGSVSGPRFIRLSLVCEHRRSVRGCAWSGMNSFKGWQATPALCAEAVNGFQRLLRVGKQAEKMHGACTMLCGVHLQAR